MDKILTVIIPTYNMENYLSYCLDSLLVKENMGLIEVLVINDGSKDASSKIAHAYADKYPQIFRVIDKENGNYGSCINRGLKEAQGKYVKILDADDSFDTTNFEQFIDFLRNTDADLVLSDFAVVDSDRNIRKVIRYNLGERHLFDLDKVCNTVVFQNMQMHAVTYLCKNLLELGYKQTEGISYTDQQWIFLPMITVQSVAYFNGFVYKYLVGRTGQTIDPKVKLKSVSHTFRCALDMACVYEQYKTAFEGKPVQAYLNARMIPFVKEGYVYVLTHYNEETRCLLSNFDKQLKETSSYIYDLIGSKEVSSFRGFEYINYWRNHQQANKYIVRLLSWAYLGLLRMKQMNQKQDEMALPVSF